MGKKVKNKKQNNKEFIMLLKAGFFGTLIFIALALVFLMKTPYIEMNNSNITYSSYKLQINNSINFIDFPQAKAWITDDNLACYDKNEIDRFYKNLYGG